MAHPTLEGWLLVFKKIRRQHPRWLVCPPLNYRWDVIAMIHDVLGHSGVTQTLIVAHQHFHWVGIKTDIYTYVSTCEACQRVKARLPQHPTLQRPVENGPLNHVHIDLFGPYSKNLSKRARVDKDQKV